MTDRLDATDMDVDGTPGMLVERVSEQAPGTTEVPPPTQEHIGSVMGRLDDMRRACGVLATDCALIDTEFGEGAAEIGDSVRDLEVRISNHISGGEA